MTANVTTWKKEKKRKKANEGTSAAGYIDTFHIL
jgi:hypothetical protein